jgi:Spy/CpxP family protein refolding chaperone
MNLIQKISVLGGIALSLAIVASPAMAQGGNGGGGGRRRGGQVNISQIPVKILAPALKLTDDQKTQIFAIETKLQADIKALEEPNIPQQSRPLIQKANADITALLTDDEKALVPALNNDIQALNTAGVPTAALEELNLTDDEKTQIIKIGTDARADMRAKMQAANGDQTQTRQIMTDSRAAALALTTAVLTDDQKTILKKYPAQQFGGGGRRGGGGGGGAAGGAAGGN